MNGDGQNDKVEDQILTRLIEHLDSRAEEAPLLLDDALDGEYPAAREYLELLGLLPYALDEAQASSSTKQDLMVQIRAASIEASELSVARRDVGDLTLVGSSPDATGSTPSVDKTFSHRVASADQVPQSAPVSTNVHTFPASPQQPNLKPWFYSIAAMLGLCLLGLSFMAGRLSELTRTTGELKGAFQQAGPSVSEYAELLRIRDQFDMITTVARQAYPMRPASAGNSGKAATGTIFVCGAHQQWYLNLQNLDPPPPQKQYRLWFLTQEGTVQGGVLEVDGNSTAELDASTMPTGTHGFAVTLEDVGTKNEQPDGPFVLIGENSVPL